MDRNLLISELQALIVETKRKYPDVRDAAERALIVLRPGVGKSAADFTPDAQQILMAPILGGCKTKVPKVVAISIGALQRLVGLHAISQSGVPSVLSTLSAAASQGVEIQLRVVQTLLSLLTYCPDVHQSVLGEVLSLYFKLQDQKTSVVSSTASASLRQAVVLVFERVGTSKGKEIAQPYKIALPEGETVHLSADELDAYELFSDLCVLTEGKKGAQDRVKILKMSNIVPTFGLELLESVLSGFADGFRTQPELVSQMRHSLCPLLIKILSDRTSFPIMLRGIRVVFLLLRYFASQIPDQAEQLWTLLIRGASNDPEAFSIAEGGGRTGKEQQTTLPLWLRSMVLEVIKALCRDPEVLRSVWQTYDIARGKPVFRNLVEALHRILSEKPAELGMNSEMHGVGVSQLSPDATSGTKQSGYIDMGLNAVSTAAHAGFTTVSAMIGTEGDGRLDASCAAKLQIIEQHDKPDPVPVPERYPYLLAVEILAEIVDALAFEVYTNMDSIASEAVQTQGDPVVDLSDDAPGMGSETPNRRMMEFSWPALLAAFSYLMTTNLSNDLFDKCLRAFKSLATISDDLHLITSRDAFLHTLARFAVPPLVVTACQSYTEVPPTPRSTSMLNAESLGLNAITGGSGASRAPGLSERNIACLSALTAIARERSATLNAGWHDVLETLQNANFVLSKGGSARKPGASDHAGIPGSPTRARMQLHSNNSSPHINQLEDADSDSVLGSINELIAGTGDLGPESFTYFVKALCRLSTEMLGLESDAEDVESLASPRASFSLSRTESGESASRIVPRRRASGMQFARPSRSGERSFGLVMLHVACKVNLERLAGQDPDLAWTPIVRHILAVIKSSAPSVVRVQAAELLGNLIIWVTSGDDLYGASAAVPVHSRVLEALKEEIKVDAHYGHNINDIELRTMALRSLHEMLESSGHSIGAQWPKIFEIVDGVCAAADEAEDNDQGGTTISTIKARANLIRTAFPSLNLACSDYLSEFDLDTLGGCIESLIRFAQQPYESNISLSSIGLLWNAMDALLRHTDAGATGKRDALWLRCLNGLLDLSADPRSEIRLSAIQTLFRSLQANGADMTVDSWNSVQETVLLPLLRALSIDKVGDQSTGAKSIIAEEVDEKGRDESSALALDSVRSVLDINRDHISRGSNFQALVRQLNKTAVLSFERGGPKACNAALKACSELCASLDAGAAGLSLDSEVYWNTVEAVLAILEKGDMDMHLGYRLTQDNLLETIRFLSSLSSHGKASLTEARCDTLLRAVRAAVTYTASPYYPPDNDQPSPLQQAGLDLIISDALAIACPPRRILSLIAEFVALAFVGSFEYVDSSMPGSSAKRGARKSVSYVGLSKAAMPVAVAYIRQHGCEAFVDGTLEQLLGSLSLPMKLRADCPPAYKYGPCEPLWQTAGVNFAAIAVQLVPRMPDLQAKMQGPRHDSLWQQILEGFRAVLLADCSYLDEGSEEEVEKDEQADWPMLEAFEQAVLPTVGYESCSDHTVQQCADVLNKGSVLYTAKRSARSEKGKEQAELEDDLYADLEVDVNPMPKESLRYRIFDIMFAAAGCPDSAATSDTDHSRRIRLAKSILPLLIARCRAPIEFLLKEAPLRGQYPFERVREDELGYILAGISQLVLWEGTFPVEGDGTESKGLSISRALLSSPRAHLFHLYPLLLQLISSSIKLPIVTLPELSRKGAKDTAANGAPMIQADVRKLALRCLQILGEEMGV